MRTLEEVLANIPVSWSSVTAWDARALIREAHALGRSEMEAEVAKLRAEARVWYGPNGPEDLDPEEVVRRRKAAAEEMKRLRAEGEERERALREALEKIANGTATGSPLSMGSTRAFARAALRPHKEEP